MITNRSDAPGAVAQVLPAASVSTVTPSIPSSRPGDALRAVRAAREPVQLPQARHGARGVDADRAGRHQRTAGPGAG